jgi:anti-sigma regulatory factor (Ser/Thr protein kinase)
VCSRLAHDLVVSDSADDVTALALTVRGRNSPLHASTELVADLSAAGAARRFVAGHLGAWGAESEAIATAELCVSELVTNAVIHTGTHPTVTVRLDEDYVFVLVSDEGGRGVVRRPDEAQPDDISGRGLALVDALSSAWGAERTAEGTTVWFELER